MTDTELKRLQEAELHILVDIDRVCRENDIDYFLDSGTMLGAARHGGFIPWDDDVDIAMPRESYERFLAIGQESLGSRYFLQTFSSDPSAPFSFAKVRMNGTEMVERVFDGSRSHQGIWVDIFPFDKIYNKEQNIRKKYKEWALRHDVWVGLR